MSLFGDLPLPNETKKTKTKKGQKSVEEEEEEGEKGETSTWGGDGVGCGRDGGREKKRRKGNDDEGVEEKHRSEAGTTTTTDEEGGTKKVEVATIKEKEGGKTAAGSSTMRASMLKLQRAKMLRGKSSSKDVKRKSMHQHNRQLQSSSAATVAPPSIQTGFAVDVVDEYDPSKPNSYEDAKKAELKRLEEEEDRKRRRRRREEEEENRRRIKAAKSEKKKTQKGGGEDGHIKPGAGKGMSMAMKLMKSMGWSEGKGLGKNEQGIETPLAVKKTSKEAGRIVQSKSVFKPRRVLEEEIDRGVAAETHVKQIQKHKGHRNKKKKKAGDGPKRPPLLT